MGQHVVRIALGLVVVALFVGYAAQFYRVDFVTRFDHLLYDTRLRLTAPGGIDDRIVILDIDERSLATPGLGRWPWGRDVQAGLVRKLFEKYRVALVAFDVVNGERDRSSGLPVLARLATGELKDVREFQEALERVRPRLDHDGVFAAAIKGRPVVLGFYFTNPETEANGTLPGLVFRELDRVRVKGKDAPVAIFEPIGRENEVAKERVEELKLWSQTLKLYRARNWDQAELILFNLQRLYPGTPLYSLYADRVARYRHESPGPGWDGVTAFETK